MPHLHTTYMKRMRSAFFMVSNMGEHPGWKGHVSVLALTCELRPLSLLLAGVSHVLCLTCMCHHHAQHTLKSALSAHPAPSRDPSLLFVICLECASTLCANTRAYVIFALSPPRVCTRASICMRGEFVYVCSTHMRHKSWWCSSGPSV